MKSIFGCSNAQTINYFPLMDNILYSTYLMPLYFDCVHHLFLLIYNAHQNFSVIALLCIGFSSDIFWQCFYIIMKILSVKWYCKTLFSTLWRFILSFMDQNHLVINRKSKQRPTKLQINMYFFMQPHDLRIQLWIDVHFKGSYICHE